ncbi:MAG: formate dehydrogenase FDH3 subunit beta [Rhodocyclaceae bacterium]|nr:formate dehydrogenase FDH3 subunit beta [Rhodocyclaceae bacterium]
MARMKFVCDSERCIECNGCVTACKNEHEVPWGISRRRVVTLNDGVPGERSVSVACMHCTDAPCMAVCPVDCFYQTDEGVVLHDKDLCIGCGYCFYACPFGAPQFPQGGAFGQRGKMDKCTFCAGGPEPDNSAEEFKKYGRKPPGRGQAADLRRDVLDQSLAGRRRSGALRHHPRSRDQARQECRHDRLGYRLRRKQERTREQERAREGGKS